MAGRRHVNILLVLIKPSGSQIVFLKGGLKQPQAAAEVSREASDEDEEEEPVESYAELHELARLFLPVLLEKFEDAKQLQ